MLGLSIRYFKKNKKQSLTIICAVILVSVLFFSVGILFSSFRQYLINKVIKENDYHVKIIGNVTFDENIISLKENDGEYYIKFNDIYKSYEYTERLCHTNDCKEIFYNNKLFSLYGIGDNNYLELFMSLIIGIIVILSVSVFFIIYNVFQMVFIKKRNDIFLFLTSGADWKQILKIFLFEDFILSILGIVIGFFLSIGLNLFLIKIINSVLFEFLNGKLGFYCYIPFILIPFIFIIVIILISSVLPLLKIKKYKIMDIFKKDDVDKSSNFQLKNFALSLAFVNYERNKKKYRNLILCIFILIILFNSFFSFINYTLKIFNDFLNLPKYDVSLSTFGEDYEKLGDFSDYLKALEKNIFKTCVQKIEIPLKNYNAGFQKTSNLMITNLGGNNLINLVDNATLKGNKMYVQRYIPFKNINSLVIGDYKINVSLSSKVPFGFENLLLEGNYILNLSENDFNLICPEYSGMAFIRTKENGLDKKITDYAKKNDFYDLSYVNVKKGYEFINNVILILKVFMLISIFIIGVIAILVIFNIVSANIKIRKKEFCTLKSLGFEHINLCLFIESLIICLKGCFYAFPFVLLINRYLWSNFEKFFDIKVMVFDYKVFLVSVFASFILVLSCMFLSHLNLYKNSLIKNIKDDKF